jgi:hypothetical protein
VLTWRRDWINMLWALKSFYHFSGVDYPLYIHDGGLLPSNCRDLLWHFPDARIVTADEADRRVVDILRNRGLVRCIAYRSRNVATRKLFDFFALSNADRILSIDSDILFFQNPTELCAASRDLARNLYNKDEGYWYSMTPNEFASAFGTIPISFVNSGLFLVTSKSIDFNAIEQWLSNPKLSEDRWISEQTLHALCSSAFGVQLLPDTYLVSTKRGLTNDLVCKHYPGFHRPLLYEEGMKYLLRNGFVGALHRRSPATKPASLHT